MTPAVYHPDGILALEGFEKQSQILIETMTMQVIHVLYYNCARKPGESGTKMCKKDSSKNV